MTRFSHGIFALAALLMMSGAQATTWTISSGSLQTWSTDSANGVANHNVYESGVGPAYACYGLSYGAYPYPGVDTCAAVPTPVIWGGAASYSGTLFDNGGLITGTFSWTGESGTADIAGVELFTSSISSGSYDVGSGTPSGTFSCWNNPVAVAVLGADFCSNNTGGGMSGGPPRTIVSRDFGGGGSLTDNMDGTITVQLFDSSYTDCIAAGGGGCAFSTVDVTAEWLFTTGVLPLESRLGGLAYYDPNLNITWAADANINFSAVWPDQMTWVSGLTIGGVGGWRLPTTAQPDLSCSLQQPQSTFPDIGIHEGCTGSEMGYLVNVEGITAATPGPFSNVQPFWYWSSTEVLLDDLTPDIVFVHQFDAGDLRQSFGDAIATGALYAWPVQSGDVGVDISTAGPMDVAFVTGIFVPAPGSTDIIEYEGLNILDGGSYELGVGEILILDVGDGTLHVFEGGVFSGNGIVDGNIFNEGLVRIPITALPLSSIWGGHVEILEPDVPEPVITPPGPVIINDATRVSVGSFSREGVGYAPGSGSGGGSTGKAPKTSVVVIDEDIQDNQGVFAVDASLEVTGTFTQTATGALRLFVGGDTEANFGPSKSGGTYSQLFVGKAVILDGTLQIALMPELFADFGYTPQVGDEFKFVMSDVSVTLEPGLQFQTLISVAGAELVSGLTFTPFDSGIAADPDVLFEVQETLFEFSLSPDGKILTGTLVQSFTVFADSDFDDVPDSADNCTAVSNGPHDTATAGPSQNNTNTGIPDIYGNMCDADFNDNGVVDSDDASVLFAQFGMYMTDPSFRPDVDMNGNGVIDSNDASRLFAAFGQPPGPSGIAPPPSAAASPALSGSSVEGSGVESDDTRSKSKKSNRGGSGNGSGDL